MRDIRLAAAQFEYRDGDKDYNLARVRELARSAAEQGAEIVCFHECCLTGYSFVQTHTREALARLAEPVPDGPSTQALIAIARELGVALLAGLFERDGDRLHNTCVCVTGQGLVARHRKLHTFVSRHLTPGNEITVFDLAGCRCAILICYDNNLPENVRIAALRGAEIVLMPHVTGCLPSTMPGRGIVDPTLWANRDRDPVPLRQEFTGPKGRGWLMRWLPARAWENGVYAVFANAIGRDAGEIRPGLSMILDPFGEVLAECTALGDDVVVGMCAAEKLQLASGRRYLRARRPELYAPLVEPGALPPLTEPGWRLKAPPDDSGGSAT